MSITTTITCDLQGTQCHKAIEKPYSEPPEGWVHLRGDRRVDLCPPCANHATRQMKDQVSGRRRK